MRTQLVISALDGTSPTTLTEQDVMRCSLVDNIKHVLNHVQGGAPICRWLSHADARELHVEWAQERWTTISGVLTMYSYTGPFLAWWECGTGVRRCLQCSVVQRQEYPRRYAAGGDTSLRMVTRLSGMLVNRECPVTWAGTASQGSITATPAGPVAMIVERASDGSLMQFSLEERFDESERDAYEECGLMPDQLRTLSGPYQRSNRFEQHAIPIRLATGSTVLKVGALIDWGLVTIYPKYLDSPSTKVTGFFLPERAISYIDGVPELGTVVALNFIATEAVAQPSMLGTYVTDTGAEWRGAAEVDIDLDECTGENGPDGDDDPDGLLAFGLREGDIVAKWGATSSAPAAICCAEFDGEIWGFFTTKAWVGTGDQGCQVARWDSAAEDWTDWETLSDDWNWYRGEASGTQYRIEPPVAVTDDGIYAVSSGGMAAGWMLWHYDGSTWSQVSPVSGTHTGEWVTALHPADDGAVLIAGNSLQVDKYHVRMWRWVEGALTTVISGVYDAGGNHAWKHIAGFGTFGGVYYCAIRGKIVTDALTCILYSDDGITWSVGQTIQSLPTTAQMYYRARACVVLPSRIMWCGYSAITGGIEWPYYDGDAWATESPNTLNASLFGPQPNLAGTRFFAWVPTASPSNHAALYRSEVDFSDVDATPLTYGGVSAFNPWLDTLGFSPRISTGIWCGGTDAAGNACFWGLETTQGPDGSRVVRHDSGSTGTRWQSVLLEGVDMDGGALTIRARASDETAVLDAMAWQMIELASWASNVAGVRGRYLDIELAWTDAGPGGEIDKTTWVYLIPR